MKYLSWFILAFALISTWNLVHQTPKVSFETHAGIQERLAELIIQTIQAKLPAAKDVKVEKIWTEKLRNDDVKAFFIYSFNNTDAAGATATTIQGEGLLTPDTENQDLWVLKQVKTNSDAVIFEEATIIKPGEPDSPEPKPTEGKTESPSEGKVDSTNQ